MRKIWLALPLLCLAGVLISAAPEGDGYSIDTPYAYPVTPGMPEWAAMDSLRQRVEACQIPEEILSELTTPALIDTVLEFPLAVNLYAYLEPFKGWEGAIETLSRQSNGLAELLRRQAEDPEGTNAALTERLSLVPDTDDFESMFAHDLLTHLVEGSTAPES